MSVPRRVSTDGRWRAKLILNTPVQAAYVSYTRNVEILGFGADQLIVVAGTQDGGTNWSEPLRINDDLNGGLPSGGLSACPTVGPNGELYVVWDTVGDTSILIDYDRDGLFGSVYNFGTDRVVRDNDGLVYRQMTPAQPDRGLRVSPIIRTSIDGNELYVTFHERFSGVDTDIQFGRHSA